MLFGVHIVQFEITFDKHVEIHLNDGKCHICLIIVETCT